MKDEKDDNDKKDRKDGGARRYAERELRVEN